MKPRSRSVKADPSTGAVRSGSGDPAVVRRVKWNHDRAAVGSGDAGRSQYGMDDLAIRKRGLS